MIVKEADIKKYLTLVLLLLCSYTVFGQTSVEYILKAKALREDGKPDKAINLLSEAIAVQADVMFYLERAEAFILKGDYPGALHDYNEANLISGSSGEYGLSRIYALKGDAATSLYHLEMNLNSKFKKGEKEVKLDPAFGAIENRSEWRQFWKKEWYSSKERSLSELEYYISSGKTAESNAVISELIKNYPEDEDIIFAKALLSYSAGKYPEVIRILSALTAEDSSNEKYLKLLAKAQTSSGNAVAASNTYARLIASGIPDAQLFILRAESYRKTGESAKALDDIKKYLELYPKDKEALSLAGKTATASGDNLKALEYFSENLRLHPNDPDCYIDRANAYFVSKSWGWAISDYSMSLDLDPGNSDTWLNKGIVLLKSGNSVDACHDFRKSFSLGNKKASEYISRNCIK